MRLVLDTGPLIALERNDRAMWRRFKSALTSGAPPLSHGGIVAQAWRGSARSARLSTVLAAIEVRGIDDALGRKTGELLRRSRTRDVVDAALVLLAYDGDVILTSDPDAIALLAHAAERDLEIVKV